MSAKSGREGAHVRICSACFSELALERDKARDKEQDDRGQLCASLERIEQIFLVLCDLAVCDQQVSLPDDKQQSDDEQNMESVW